MAEGNSQCILLVSYHRVCAELMLGKNRPKRNIRPINYKILGSTGKKVAIDRRNLSKMEKMVDTEEKITRKLTRFFDEYDISLLFGLGVRRLVSRRRRKLRLASVSRRNH